MSYVNFASYYVCFNIIFCFFIFLITLEQVSIVHYVTIKKNFHKQSSKEEITASKYMCMDIIILNWRQC